MLNLLSQGDYALFAIVMVALICSLTFHEYGHAVVAYWYGDGTAKEQGRLTLNPLPHIDPFGLLMIVFIGFGFAKPVPVNGARLNSRWAMGWVSVAGPFMNLLLAIVTINIFSLGIANEWSFFLTEQARYFFVNLAIINLILMVFNLIPLGPLDGHYILPYFLPRSLSMRYRILNAKFGNYVFIALIVLSLMGVPVFTYVLDVGKALLPYIVFL
jgi:Zn-dependent protease